MEFEFNCEHCDKKFMYAYIEINDQSRIISAYEYGLFDKYLELAHNDDKEIVVNLEQSENEPYQIVYGSLIINNFFTVDEAINLANQMRNYAFFDITEDRVNVSGYADIVFDYKNQYENKIPFAALMQMPHRLKNIPYSSITLFPALKNYKTVWEKMINRPFILACRDSQEVEGITEENWAEYFNKQRMMSAFKIAELVF